MMGENEDKTLRRLLRAWLAADRAAETAARAYRAYRSRHWPGAPDLST